MLDMVLNLTQLQNSFVVYSHEISSPDGPRGILYVGCCPYKDLLSFPDASRNSEWRKIVKDYPSITLKVLSVVETPEAAEALQLSFAVILNAWCNKNGQQMIGRNSPIRCIEDNREFKSISDAARHYKIPPTSISNHLAGRQGYGHVRNLRFERI